VDINLSEIKGILARHRGKLIIVALLVIAYYVLIVKNPLPGDEDMIAHFQTHRSDIEELVRRYRNYSTDPKVDHSLWFKEGNTQEIMRRASVDRITQGSITPWLPNPYSIETAKTITEEIKNGKGHVLFNKQGALIMSFAPRQYYRASHLRYVNIWKNFYFIPEPPRIEDGELLWPFNDDGDYFARRRTLPSLDHFPKNWKDYECVYRQIETHWFLSMCNGH
jgi:hypothetical protein